MLIPVSVDGGGGKRAWSSHQSLLCGMPQGLVFFPLFLFKYIRLLGKVIQQFEGKYHQYADGTQLYTSTQGYLSDAMEVLSQCLEAVAAWMVNNRLWLNQSKNCVALSVGILWCWGPSVFLLGLGGTGSDRSGA